MILKETILVGILGRWFCNKLCTTRQISHARSKHVLNSTKLQLTAFSSGAGLWNHQQMWNTQGLI